jgi:molecular chaperone GrpE
LDVADNLERALSFADGAADGLADGVRATLRVLEQLLEREGVARIDAADAPFDPGLHEAVGVIEVPGMDGERVVAVERAGYTIGGELLRAARVVVGRGPEA